MSAHPPHPPSPPPAGGKKKTLESVVHQTHTRHKALHDSGVYHWLRHHGTQLLHIGTPIAAAGLSALNSAGAHPWAGSAGSGLEHAVTYLDLAPAAVASVGIMHMSERHGKASYAIRSTLAGVMSYLVVRHGVDAYQAATSGGAAMDVMQHVARAAVDLAPAYLAWHSFRERNHPHISDIWKKPVAYLAHIVAGASAWLAPHGSTPTGTGSYLHDAYATTVQLFHDLGYVGQQLAVNPLIAAGTWALHKFKPKGWVGVGAAAGLFAFLGWDMAQEGMSCYTNIVGATGHAVEALRYGAALALDTALAVPLVSAGVNGYKTRK